MPYCSWPLDTQQDAGSTQGGPQLLSWLRTPTGMVEKGWSEGKGDLGGNSPHAGARRAADFRKQSAGGPRFQLSHTILEPTLRRTEEHSQEKPFPKQLLRHFSILLLLLLFLRASCQHARQRGSRTSHRGARLGRPPSASTPQLPEHVAHEELRSRRPAALPAALPAAICLQRGPSAGGWWDGGFCSTGGADSLQISLLPAWERSCK